ncbi:hypothetical protein [Asanoa iriomotensis]|uniref:Immunoglobulin-like protein involved in spore germination n=1 Tax=Asanoa iriomotensis TaxID=234613 RepID=A0ABQ4BYT2_9ACTN|nr:hypothetical protein [Asanoa iriomotensis]GIF55699.1 hypothetical protein Air01nite_17940 [Asanoa iriomotensis]
MPSRWSASFDQDQAEPRPDPAPPQAPAPARTVSTTVTLASALVAVLAGFALARLTSARPDVPAAPSTASATQPTSGAGVMGSHNHAGGTAAAGGAGVVGLAVSAQGFTLEPQTRSQSAGDFRYRIIDKNRAPVTAFTGSGDKAMHLTVVRADLTGFQHLHPTMALDGTWTTPLSIPGSGAYRVYADFTATGADGSEQAVTLGVDHTAPGTFRPQPPPAPKREQVTGDITVTMEGTPLAGASVPLQFRVYAAGAPASAWLARHHGAFGRLVVIREGDFGVVPTYADAELVGGALKVWLTMPTPGRYRANLELDIDGRLRSVPYTLVVA